METWLPVPEYEHLYEVSDLGRVRGLKFGRVLKPAPDGHGYLHVILSKAGKPKNRTIHSLVAEAFIGPCPKGLEVNHIDRIRSNCTLTNLEYLTRLENIRHSIAMENPNRQKGERHHLTHLKDVDVIEIKQLYAKGLNKKDIGKQFQVNRTTIHDIVTGKTWNHIQLP